MRLQSTTLRPSHPFCCLPERETDGFWGWLSKQAQLKNQFSALNYRKQTILGKIYINFIFHLPISLLVHVHQTMALGILGKCLKQIILAHVDKFPLFYRVQNMFFSSSSSYVLVYGTFKRVLGERDGVGEMGFVSNSIDKICFEEYHL